MKVSIGQYVPGNSIFHKADPRSKILWTLIMMILLLLLNDFVSYGIAAIFVIVAIIISKINIRLILRSLSSVAVLIAFTMILNVFFYKGTTPPIFEFWMFSIYKEGIFFSLKMVIRIMLLISSSSLLTYTTTSVMLTDGIEQLLRPLSVVKVPVHDIAMMMSIALRFIPTFSDETDRIMKAQTARGSDLSSPNIIVRIKSFVPILVPLFVSAFRHADELATAMEAKCYRGGDGRTRYRVLKFSSADIFLLIYIVLFSMFVIFNRIFWRL